MDHITISSPDGGERIQMPPTRQLSLAPKEECRELQMASGRMVKEVIGVRQTITASWDWVPAETIARLCALLNRGGYFRVEYPAPEGDRAELCGITPPAPRVFRYKDGVARWHDITLTMTGQEVG